jgi:hypothetical protein
MTTSTRPSRTDQRVADEAAVDQSLLCSAHGCPNRWSVDAGHGKACRAHAWAQPHDWPQITVEQQDAETDRALRAMQPPLHQATPTPDPGRLRRVLARLRLDSGSRTPAMKVAERLRAMAAQRHLNPAQAEMLKACESRNPRREPGEDDDLGEDAQPREVGPW